MAYQRILERVRLDRSSPERLFQDTIDWELQASGVKITDDLLGAVLTLTHQESGTVVVVDSSESAIGWGTVADVFYYVLGVLYVRLAGIVLEEGAHEATLDIQDSAGQWFPWGVSQQLVMSVQE